MSFFLFCCLVLIILQGPLGLSGIGTAAVTGGAGGLSVFGSLGGVGNGVNLGGGIGCGGMAAGYVPWCQQVGGVGMVSARQLPIQQQVQVQQVPAVVHHHHPQAQVIRQVPQGYSYTQVPGYEAQGSIALPGGGGGSWSSWYGNPAQHYRQYGKSGPLENS